MEPDRPKCSVCGEIMRLLRVSPQNENFFLAWQCTCLTRTHEGYEGEVDLEIYLEIYPEGENNNG